MKNITNKSLKRMIELMGNKTPINENKTISSVELVKKSPNGNFYGIVKENKKYFIKESNDGSNFNFIGGVANKTKNQFESYEQAVRRLNLMLEDTNVLTPDVITEKKFVIKTKKKKATEPKADTGFGDSETDFDFGGSEETPEEGTDFDFGDDETGKEDEDTDFDFGGEEKSDESGDDFGGDDKETEGDFDTEDEDYDLESEDDPIKSIQKMTGKLGQKLRDTEDVSSDMSKWVAKSVLSALNLEDMDSDDKKDLIRTIKKKKSEGSDEEFDFMNDNEQVMSTPILTYMSNKDMVDWNKLTDEEKAEIVGRGSEEDYMEGDFGPGDDKIETGEQILSDDEDEDNCSYCGDRNQPYYDDETEMGGYPAMGEDWMSDPKDDEDEYDNISVGQESFMRDHDFMSKFAKDVKRAGAVKGKKMEAHEIDNHLNKIKNKLGGSVNIDDDKVVGAFGYVEVKPYGYVAHKEGKKFGKEFRFDELGKLHDYVKDMDEDYMDDPYMMPQPAPARPQTRPETPVKPAKPDTDKPSPSKRPFTPPPHITPGEEPNPKAEYDEYGMEDYGPNEVMDYMEEPEYYGSFEKDKWLTPMDSENNVKIPSYEYKEFEYPDYESFRASEFGQDPKNRWFGKGEKGKYWFDVYSKKFGPMKVRKRTETDFDQTSKMLDDLDYMEDNTTEVCSTCQGKGHEKGGLGFNRKYNPCITCAGTGRVPREEMEGEVDEPYVDEPFNYESDSTMPSSVGFRYHYKEKFNFPFNMGENSSRNKRTIKEDHINNKMATYDQEMAYEDVEAMARQHGMDVEFCHKDRSKDPEEETIYLDLMKNGKAVAKIRINSVGDVEMGHMKGKVFKGEPVDSHSDFDEVLDEKNIKTPMNPAPAPARPQTRPETPTKPAPTKPGTDKPSPSKRPFTPPPHITPGEEPNPKAGVKRKSLSYMGDDSKSSIEPSKPSKESKPKRRPFNPPPSSKTPGSEVNKYRVEGYRSINKKKINEEAPKVSKAQLFKSLDNMNLSDEKLSDLSYMKKLIDNVLDKEFDFVADNTEVLAKEYITRNK